jgi:hypothetical protein
LKLHFTSESYDYIKFNGKTRASVSSYNNRKDRHFFDKLARTQSKDIFGFLLSNFLDRGDFWIGELFDDEAESTFTEWKRRIQSLGEKFNEDSSKIVKETIKKNINFDDLFNIENGSHPAIMKMVMREDICIESFIILDCLLGFFGKFKKELNDDFLWVELESKCNNYKPFILRLLNNLPKYRKILLNKIKEND